jgi:hypothetical protein
MNNESRICPNCGRKHLICPLCGPLASQTVPVPVPAQQDAHFSSTNLIAEIARMREEIKTAKGFLGYGFAADALRHLNEALK